MNGQRTLARPYAKAIFELAAQQQQLTNWSQLLSFLATLAKDPQVQPLYHDPRCSSQQLQELFISLMTAARFTDEAYRNLLCLLAAYRRLPLLPAIAELFEENRARLEKSTQVVITSAFPVQETLRQRLQETLTRKLQCAVAMTFEVDKRLLGGAIIRAGDLVIDGSVRARLQNLQQSLVN